MKVFIIFSVIVSGILGVSVYDDSEWPALRFDPEINDWVFYSLRKGPTEKYYIVQRRLNDTEDNSQSLIERRDAEIKNKSFKNIFRQVGTKLARPSMRENRPTTFWTDFVQSVVELRPSDLTLFWCDKRDINSCGQADYPGAGVCGGIFGLDVCFCHLSNFVYDIRTGKCKPVKPDATVCSIGKSCAVGEACVEPNPLCRLGGICEQQTTALAVPGSSCSSPKDGLFQCDCPETHQFNPRSCKCIKLDEECAKKKNQCNRIDLFAKCISLEFPDQNNRTYQCLCSFGFTPTKGSCLADLGLWSGSVRLRIWVGGVAVGIVGVIIGVIYIIWNVLRILLPIIGPLLGLDVGNSSNTTNTTNSTNGTMNMMDMNTTRSDYFGSPGIIMGLTACENLSLMRRRMRYDVNVNEAFDRIMYALSCKPSYFDGSEDEFEFE